MNFWKPYIWRIAFTILGLAASISFLTLGFWRTILILLCCGIGYTIGMYQDRIIGLPEWFWFWRDR